MKVAKGVFTLAGIYGLIVMLPLLFQEGAITRAEGALTRPEDYYGFVGAAVVFQLLFLLIGRDPMRFRPAMIVGVLEKLSFGVPVWLLYAQGRVQGAVLVFASIDLFLGALFAVSYVRTQPAKG